jgi:hypothetical protein
MVDRGRDAVAQAPGGTAHETAYRDHGPAKDVHITYEGPSRWHVWALHADGHIHESTHPEAYIAHHVGGTLVGADNPPLGQATHKNAKNVAHGQKEDELITEADKREYTWDDYADDER